MRHRPLARRLPPRHRPARRPPPLRPPPRRPPPRRPPPLRPPPLLRPPRPDRMHPLLARPARLLLVVATAALLGVPLAWLLRLLEPRSWVAALAFAVPMQVFYSFIVLSAWWVCRRHPISGDT